MKRQWHDDELTELFSLSDQERRLLAHKGRNPESLLGYAVLLKFFQVEGRFPRYKFEIPPQVLAFLARQLELAPGLFKDYAWKGRNVELHRRHIRAHLGYRVATLQDAKDLVPWLIQEVLVEDTHPEFVTQRLLARFRHLRIEPPSAGRFDRLVNSAQQQFEQALCE